MLQLNDEKAPDAPEDQRAATLKLDKLEGKDVLIIDASKYASEMVSVGPKVKGDYVVEFTAKMLSEKMGDLSLFIGAISEGPAFQMGSWENTKNQLWTGPMKMPDGTSYAFPNPTGGPMIERDKWYTIKLDVKGNKVSASIDGKDVLGQPVPLQRDYDGTVARQAGIYTFASKIAVQNVKIDQYGSLEAMKADEAFAKAFGKATRDDVQKQIHELVDCLADPDQTLREASTQIICHLGDLAIPALKDAAEKGDPEQAMRAQELIKTLEGDAPALPVEPADKDAAMKDKPQVKILIDAGNGVQIEKAT